MIIGFSGYAGSGKDTAADALIEDGYQHVSFADALKQMAYAIDPYVQYSHMRNVTVRDGVRPMVVQGFERLSTMVDLHGWDYCKNKYPDVRRLLQRVGTEGGRDIFGDNIWIDTAFNKIDGNAVITDVRFKNEMQAILDRGGFVIRIEREGVGPRNDHPSETELSDAEFSTVVHNNGSIEELYAKVREAVENLTNKSS